MTTDLTNPATFHGRADAHAVAPITAASRLFVLALGSSWLLILLLAGIGLFSAFRQDRMIHAQVRLTQLKASLVHVDEVLTMSALMATRSNDPVWLNRYRENEPVVERILQELFTLGGDDRELTGLVNQLAESASVLLKIENVAFKSIELGRKDEAWSALRSAEYLGAKNRFDATITKVINHIQRSLDFSKRQSQYRIIFSLLSLLLMIPMGILSYVAFRSLSRERDLRAQGVQSAKMAALGEMAGGVAHEINNPLAVIHGKAAQLSELMSSGRFDQERVIQGLQRIEVTALRISRIVRGLQRFSRDASGDPMQKVSVKELIEDTLTFCAERFKHHNVHLDIAPVPGDWKLECQAVQISEVLLNLLNNSYDATEGLSDRWIRLSAQDCGSRYRLLITDSGPGIPPHLLNTIFQPFFTTKGVGKGTGLGLSLSKGIVEQHAGSLYVDTSSPNTRFVVELPKSQVSGT